MPPNFKVRLLNYASTHLSSDTAELKIFLLPQRLYFEVHFTFSNCISSFPGTKEWVRGVNVPFSWTATIFALSDLWWAFSVYVAFGKNNTLNSLFLNESNVLFIVSGLIWPIFGCVFTKNISMICAHVGMHWLHWWRGGDRKGWTADRKVPLLLARLRK